MHFLNVWNANLSTHYIIEIVYAVLQTYKCTRIASIFA